MTAQCSAVPSIAAVSMALALAPSLAMAEAPTATGDAGVAPRRQPAAVDLARFVPGVVAAETGAQTGAGSGWAGYDGATRTPLVGASAEVRLGTRVVIGAGATYASRASDEPAAVRPSVLARVQILDQRSHGIDLGAAVAYRQDRFVTEDGLFQATLSIGVHGDGQDGVLVSLGYGQDGEGDDHLGDARLVAFRRLVGALHVGLDGHVQWLLDSSDPHRVLHQTPSFEITVAPALTCDVGPAMLMLEVGWIGLDLDQLHSGVVALASVGTSF